MRKYVQVFPKVVYIIKEGRVSDIETEETKTLRQQSRDHCVAMLFIHTVV